MLKGVFAKSEKGKGSLRKISAFHRYSICCVYKEKIVKLTTYTEQRSVHPNKKNCNIEHRS